MQLSNKLFEELVADVYDEVDRRETDACKVYLYTMFCVCVCVCMCVHVHLRMFVCGTCVWCGLGVDIIYILEQNRLIQPLFTSEVMSLLKTAWPSYSLAHSINALSLNINCVWAVCES